MVKEAKNIDFYTTGKRPSDQDFAKISEWIKRDKASSLKTKNRQSVRKQKAA